MLYYDALKNFDSDTPIRVKTSAEILILFEPLWSWILFTFLLFIDIYCYSKMFVQQSTEYIYLIN